MATERGAGPAKAERPDVARVGVDGRPSRGADPSGQDVMPKSFLRSDWAVELDVVELAVVEAVEVVGTTVPAGVGTPSELLRVAA